MKRQKITRLSSIISEFKGAKVMVIGDLILDEFIWGKVDRISPEAPVPVVWVDKESFMPGGASNVAHNISVLGGEVDLVGVIGDDDRGRILKAELKSRNVITDGIVTDKTRPTVLKSRVIAHKQQVVRIDREHASTVSQRVLSKVLKYIKGRISDVDILIIEDYGKGFITPELLKVVVPLAKKHKKIIAVDPKQDHFALYKGVSLITPNADETARATGIKLHNKKSIHEAGNKLLNKLNCNAVLLTLGEKGMALFKKEKRPVFIPTIAQDVYDVSGAGDTVIGTFCLALASGAKHVEAAHIANCAAGIVVGKVGIAVASQDELTAKIKEEMAR